MVINSGDPYVTAALWWENLYGPARYVEILAEACSTAGAIVINEVDEGCWPTVFIEKLQIRSQQLNNHIINWMSVEASEFSVDGDIALMVLEMISPHTAADYRPASGESPAAYMGKHGVLTNSILIVRNIQRTAAEEWLELAIDFAKSVHRSNGLLLLCFEKTIKLPHMNRKNVRVFDYAHYVSYFDLQAFAAVCVSSSSVIPILKDYLVNLCAVMCEGIPEVCRKLASMNTVQTPIECAQNVYSECAFHDVNTPEEVIERLKRSVWDAQIRSFFPIIEIARRYFTLSYKNNLSRLLPQTDEYGNVLQYESDFELRHLVHFYRNGDLELTDRDGQYLLMLHSARNDLAHLTCISNQDIGTLAEICACLVGDSNER